ncbi:MAG: tetratricopeptide repeat protein [Phascolarctobacterium sp.]|nr:tetratricopeptide repeat protein [Candidatus Phascolarctobacterium caballi]
MKKIGSAILVAICLAGITGLTGVDAAQKNSGDSKTVNAILKRIQVLEEKKDEKSQAELRELYFALGQKYRDSRISAEQAMKLGNIESRKYVLKNTEPIEEVEDRILRLERRNFPEERMELDALYIRAGKYNFTERKDYRKAAEYFSKVSVGNKTGKIYLMEANSLYAQNEYEEAITDFDSALARNDDLSKQDIALCYWYKGYAHLKLGDYVSAEKNLRKLLEVDPTKKKDVEKDMVIALDEQGKYDEALEWLRKLERGEENRKFKLRRRADILCKMGAYYESEGMIKDLEIEYPDDELINLLKTQLYLAVGNLPEAKKYHEKDFQSGRDSFYDYDSLIFRAEFALREGNYDVALRYVDMAKRDPMPAYNDKLKGDIYFAKGDRHMASSYYSRFIETTQNQVMKREVKAKYEKLMREIQGQVIEIEQ